MLQDDVRRLGQLIDARDQTRDRENQVLRSLLGRLADRYRRLRAERRRPAPPPVRLGVSPRLFTVMVLLVIFLMCVLTLIGYRWLNYSPRVAPPPTTTPDLPPEEPAKILKVDASVRKQRKAYSPTAHDKRLRQGMTWKTQYGVDKILAFDNPNDVVEILDAKYDPETAAFAIVYRFKDDWKRRALARVTEQTPLIGYHTLEWLPIEDHDSLLPYQLHSAAVRINAEGAVEIYIKASCSRDQAAVIRKAKENDEDVAAYLPEVCVTKRWTRYRNMPPDLAD